MRVIRCPYCGAEARCASPVEAAAFHLAHGCTGPAPAPPANPLVVLAAGPDSVVTK